MAFNRCFKCGKVNSADSSICEGCGEGLLTGQQYEKKYKELYDYNLLRKRYSIIGIILGIITLLLMYPIIVWFTRLLFSALGTDSMLSVVSIFAPLLIIILVLLFAILPMITGRIKIKKTYHWTSGKMRELQRDIKSLPEDFFSVVEKNSGEVAANTRGAKSANIVIPIIIFIIIALFYINEYTDFKPVNFLASFLNIENTQSENTNHVEGTYICHLEATDLGDGIMQCEQTWAFVFFSDGTYTSYLDGDQQYSGTWSQYGNILTVDVPAIANISDAYSVEAKVRQDGNSFISGDKEFIKMVDP